MKSLTQFWRVLAEDLARGSRVQTDLERDFKTLQTRYEYEGSQFLTITLPQFGKDFERSLELGHVDPDLCFHGWKFKGWIPLFLGGFMSTVFDRFSGDLLDNPDVFSIRAIRQLTLLFGKMQIPCSQERTDAALHQYVEIDNQVRINDGNYVGTGLQAEFRRTAFMLYVDVFAKLDEDVYYNRILPKHGPGATADRLTGNGKFYQLEWTDRLEAVFPYGEHCIPSWRYNHRLDDVTWLSPDDERPVRVTTVIKTQKAPRVIGIEPTGTQYCQQGLMERLVELIEAHKVLGTVIGFTDQTPNQQLAREGSLYGRLATLDLSEASDRVSYEHVMDMLQDFPFAREGVSASRSTRASVPGEGDGPPKVITLAKFASMGSALCFPMEAMVFTTVIAMAVIRQNALEHGSNATPETRAEYYDALRGVRVYGDDIIVPVDYVASVIRHLELFGFKVNTGKSFWTGKFRESCGKEFYDGLSVSVQRVRTEFPASRKDVAQIVSTVSLRNQLWEAGYYGAVDHLDSIIGPILRDYPVVEPGSAVLGRLSHEPPTVDAFDERLQVPLVRGFAVKSRAPYSPVYEEMALLKWFLKRGDKPFEDPNHLLRSGRPDAVYLKRRLHPVFGYVSKLREEQATDTQRYDDRGRNFIDNSYEVRSLDLDE